MTGGLNRIVASSQREDRDERKLLWPPLIIAIVCCWVLPLKTSLGLDETGAWWVVSGRLNQVIPRANLWQQSILHSLLVWSARLAGGDSDIVMRLPSILAMCGALYLLFKVGQRLINPLAAMFACLAFITMTDVVNVASTIRPYALGLFFVMGAMLTFINWLDTGRLGYAVVYIISATLAVYAHYFFGVMFGVHIVYAIQRSGGGLSLVPPWKLLSAWLVASVLILPLVPLAIALNSSNVPHVYLSTPGAEGLLSSFVPTIFTGSVAVACLIWVGLRRLLSMGSVCSLGSGSLLALWAAIPICVMFLISVLTEKKLFAPWYYISSAPAIALICGALVAALKPHHLRLLVATVVVPFSVVIFCVNDRSLRGAVDYRGAINAIDNYIETTRTPIVAVSAFSESRTVHAILDPNLSDVLFAPFLRYATKGKVIRVPGELTSETEPYLERVMETSLASEPRFFVVGLMLSERYQGWLAGRGTSLGFRSRLFGNYGGVEVFLFERRVDSRP